MSSRKIRSRLVSKDYNCIVDGPKSKDNYTYYSLKVKDQEKKHLIQSSFRQKSKEIALFLEPSDAKEPLKGQMLFAFNKKKNQTTMTMSKVYEIIREVLVWR